ncbi:hypothetical protein K0M31_003979, partial [Melipona bicolor]
MQIELIETSLLYLTKANKKVSLVVWEKKSIALCRLTSEGRKEEDFSAEKTGKSESLMTGQGKRGLKEKLLNCESL